MVGRIKEKALSGGWETTAPDLLSAGSGSGEINLITNPDGETALDQDATNDVGDWIATGTSVTAAVTETASEIPLSPTQTTAIKVTVGASGTDHVRVRFRVPEALRNMKNKIAWYQDFGSTYASGDLKLEVYNYSDAYATGETEIALSSDSSGTTSIPAKTGQFVTTFDTDDREYYEMRLVRTANGGAATDWISLNNVVVGPGVRAQGAVVTGWKSYTPTTQGFGTVSGVSVEYAQVGETVHVKGRITAGTVTGDEAQIGLPNGYTALVPASPLQIGTASRGATGTRDLVVLATTDDAFVNFGWTSQDTEGSGANPLTIVAGNSLISNTNTFGFEFNVRVNELVGRGTLNIGENDVEYASNSGMGDADDTSSFATGPTGSPLPGVTYTDARRKRVQFQSPIQAGDTLKVQIDRDADGTWVDCGSLQTVGGSASVQTFWDGTNGFGTIEPVSSTQVDVVFGATRLSGNNWSALTDNAYWRVVKTKAGAAVGFDAATSDALGLVKSARTYHDTYTSGATATPTSLTDLDTYTVTEAGTYLINAFANFSNGTSDATANRFHQLSLFNGATEVAVGYGTIYSNVSAGAEFASVHLSRVLTLNVGDVIKTQHRALTGSVSTTFGHGITLIPVNQ